MRVAEVCARWRLTPGPLLKQGTWEASRGATRFILKHLDYPDWQYTLRVAAALAELGWPTPVPVEEPLADGWVLLNRLPGQRFAGSQRERGQLLASLHSALTATGIARQRGGFTDPASVVTDPALVHWLGVFSSLFPYEGKKLLSYRAAAEEWFAAHDTTEAPSSVIHGDFAPWNLLCTDGRLTGLIDFEAAHHNFQVADFAMSWRGYQDDVIRGYDSVRPLSGLEWQLIRPVYWAWLFLGLKDDLAAAAGHADLSWQLAHFDKESALVPPG